VTVLGDCATAHKMVPSQFLICVLHQCNACGHEMYRYTFGYTYVSSSVTCQVR